MKTEVKLYKSALENLQQANRLLRKNRWTERDLAVDCNGKSCTPRSPEAHAFCALGAVRHVNGPGERKAVDILIEAAKEELTAIYPGYLIFDNENDIFTINDYNGYDAVKSMFRRAIRMAKKLAK